MSEEKKTAFMGAPVARLVDGAWEVDENPPVCVLCKRSGCKYARETRPNGVWECLKDAPFVIRCYYAMYSAGLIVVKFLADDYHATVRYACTINRWVKGELLDVSDEEFTIEQLSCKYKLATIPEEVNPEVIEAIDSVVFAYAINDNKGQYEVVHIDDNPHAKFDAEFEKIEDRFLDESIAWNRERA